MSAPATKKSRAALWVGLASSALVATLGVVAWVKGAVADTSVRNPERAADGVVCQLYAEAVDRTPVRCALVVEAPVDEVSAVVRDYERFPETFDSTLGSIELTSIEREGDSAHHVGSVSSWAFGEWPIDLTVLHEDGADGSRVARWQESEGEALNRGRWTVSPVPSGSLVVYELEVESPWAPRFLVNDVLLTQLSYPLRHVAARVGG